MRNKSVFTHSDILTVIERLQDDHNSRVDFQAIESQIQFKQIDIRLFATLYDCIQFLCDSNTQR